MASPILPRLRTVTLVVAATVSLSACNAVTRITPIENPTEQPGYRVVSLPMPEPTNDRFMANSLWRQGARAFFKDQRAARVGDILTVVINISDKATFDNETERTRENTEDSDITNFLGLETQLEKKLLPESFDPTSALSLGSTSKSKGVGKVDRSEELNLTVAALVTQEVRVNFEVRELLIAGVVRPEDITSSNTVQHTQIAEARISYGGRGQLTDVQQPRYGQQVMDILFPF
jgi:flagellar L-ring protein precursor FlgH